MFTLWDIKKTPNLHTHNINHGVTKYKYADLRPIHLWEQMSKVSGCVPVSPCLTELSCMCMLFRPFVSPWSPLPLTGCANVFTALSSTTSSRSLEAWTSYCRCSFYLSSVKYHAIHATLIYPRYSMSLVVGTLRRRRSPAYIFVPEAGRNISAGGTGRGAAGKCD